jgi:hypothetical protein
MKTVPFLMTGILISLLVCSSCNQTEESGQLKFGLELSDQDAMKAAATDPHVVAALVTIQGVDGAMIFDKEPLELLRFGDQFVTRSLQIPVGEFMLTEFMLIDSMGVVLWATPMEGSPLAHLVTSPLPRFFSIQPDQTTDLELQVIRVNGFRPEDFGYAQFQIGFVNHFCLKVYYTSQCVDDPNLDGTQPDPDGSMRPYYQPRLIIQTGDRVVLDEPLNPGLNRYQVPLVSEWYRVMATDCHADTFFRERFHLDELSKHRCDPAFPPLMIYDKPDSGVVITPEGLHEPTISQGVFGHLEPPLDNYMLLDSADFWNQVRDIYFFPYYVIDSIYSMAPIDCYFPIELIHVPPVGIVRSNSDGYFQLPMEVGEYFYLVKLDGGYYFDAFISSHLPGYFRVFPEEVTKLLIAVIDCSMWM